MTGRLQLGLFLLAAVITATVIAGFAGAQARPPVSEPPAVAAQLVHVNRNLDRTNRSLQDIARALDKIEQRCRP